MVEIRVEGLEALREALGDIDIEEVMAPAMADALNQVQGRISTYPSPPSGSSYIRTGTLLRGWDQVYGSGLRGSVVTRVPYAPHVQQRDTQAPVHQGRWETVEDVAEREEEAVVGFFTHRAEEVVRIVKGS